MAQPDTLSVYLDPTAFARAQTGGSPIVARLEQVARGRGMGFYTYPIDGEQRIRALGRRGVSICHTVPPFADGMLVMRPAYLPRFWRIETTADRYDFDVARRSFEPNGLDVGAAQTFARQVKARRFGANPPAARSGGYIYVPLQGVLSRKRPFQTMSPLDMLRETIRQAEGQRVVTSFHPKSPPGAYDLKQINALCARHPNLTVELGPALPWIAGCDFVVTQNSAAAFEGFFFHKPAVLFARSDFHHICANVRELGVDLAFAAARRMLGDPPPYDRYVTWFLRDCCVNPENPQSGHRIVRMLERCGWVLPALA